MLRHLLLKALQPLPALRLAAHQVAEERAQRLQLRLRPRPLLPQLAGRPLQVGFRLRPRRAFRSEALLKARLGLGRLDPRLLLQRPGDRVRFLELAARRRLALAERQELRLQRLELRSRCALGLGQGHHLRAQRLKLLIGRGHGPGCLHLHSTFPRPGG